MKWLLPLLLLLPFDCFGQSSGEVPEQLRLKEGNRDCHCQQPAAQGCQE